MGYCKYPKGSEWRKWDLHVHTPYSFHWTGCKDIKSMTVKQKEHQLEQMVDAINNSDVSVFAITDYWTFDGYIALKEYIKKTGKKLKKTVFPGMEIRIEAPVDYRLNMQIVLSNKLTMQELADFKAFLRIGFKNRAISDEAFIEFAKTLDNSKAKYHGFKAVETLSGNELLRLGQSTAEITRESLNKAFTGLNTNSGFIIMPYDTSDGLKNLDWKKHPCSDQYFMQSSHLFESRDKETIELFLGVVTKKNKEYIENFQKTLGNTPKPVIIGSDAHSYSSYGTYHSNKICWIKADPDFEGLKQIIYEPDSRIRIQEFKPEEKTSYHVIDKVRFLDNRARFSPEWLELNQSLNSIIGGKSSGKSILLYHIAASVDPIQAKEKIVTPYHFGSDFNFEVAWADGEVNSLIENEENKKRQITYIPQMYVNKLAEGTEELNQLILDILMQNEELKKLYDEFSITSHKIKQDLINKILELFNNKKLLIKSKTELKEIGDKKAIEKEIKSLKLKITKLKKSSGFTKEEETQYNKLQSNLQSIYIEKSRRIDFIQRLEEFKEHTNDEFSEFTSSLQAKISELDYDLATQEAQELNAIKLKIEKISITSFIKTIDDRLEKYNSSIKTIEKETSELETKLKPYQTNITSQEELTKLQKELLNEQNKLTAFSSLAGKMSKLEIKYDKNKEEIFALFDKLLTLYNSIHEEFSKDKFKQVSSDIELKIDLKLNQEEFKLKFLDKINKTTSLKRVSEFGLINDNGDIIFDENYVSIIKLVFEDILEDNIKLKAAQSKKDAIVSLLGDYFLYSFNLIQNSDDIMQMSPGKRGLVLLQLFLHLSNAKHPILLDQPEDNLDNRTIYTVLKEFIKRKKIERQIIIVSHNANLVVSTDSEEIVVANQAGQQVNRENRQHQFEFISGALECRFKKPAEKGILYQKGIREHVCEILEGGEDAFKKREQKYEIQIIK